MNNSNKFKLIVDALAFVDGRAPGFNNYLFNLLDALLSVLDERYEVAILVRHDQAVHFQKYQSKLKILRIRCSNVFGRVFFENFILPFYGLTKNLTIFPANISPLFFPGKHILIVCDLNFLSFPKNYSLLHNFLRNTFQKYLIIKADACVAISNVVAAEIKRYSSIKPVVIHVPIKIDVVRDSSANDHNKVTIAIPSSLAKHKNVAASYDAAIRIVSKYSHVNFIFFGGWNLSEFQTTTSHPSIAIKGRITDLERNDIFSTCSAILVPSVYEGFGMPYAEALICDIPLICSDISISREIVEDYPYYIAAPFASDDICNAIERFLTRKNGSALGNAMLVERYSDSSVGNQYKYLINRLLGVQDD